MVFSKRKTLRESGVCRSGCQSRSNGWQTVRWETGADHSYKTPPVICCRVPWKPA